jgi:hypothetical protein
VQVRCVVQRQHAENEVVLPRCGHVVQVSLPVADIAPAGGSSSASQESPPGNRAELAEAVVVGRDLVEGLCLLPRYRRPSHGRGSYPSRTGQSGAAGEGGQGVMVSSDGLNPSRMVRPTWPVAVLTGIRPALAWLRPGPTVGT